MLNIDNRIRIYKAHTTYCMPSNTPNWYWHNNASRPTHLTLWLVLSGKGYCEGEFGRIDFLVGDVILWRHRYQHKAFPDKSAGDLVVPWITFEYLDSNGLPIVIPEKNLLTMYRNIQDVTFLSGLMQRGIDAFLAGIAKESLNWLRSALFEVGRYDRMKIGTNRNAGKHAELIESVISMINSKAYERLSVDNIAEYLKISKDHLIRLFKQHKGVTPGEYIIRHRMMMACDLLTHTDMSVSDIAFQLGYADLFTFSKQFRKRQGCSPTEYRAFQ